MYKINSMKRILFFTLIVLNMIFATAQTDTLFYFAAPEVAQHNRNFDRPIVFRITSYQQPATVRVSQPANPSFPVQTVTIPTGSLSTVNLTTWIDQIENKPSNSVLNYGLKIQSTAPITVYYEVVSEQCDCNPEIFVLKGQSAQGVDFWIPSQNLAGNNQSFFPITNSSFDVVATKTNTVVTIVPSRNIVGHPAGIPFSINLNEGQTYSAMATSGLAIEHLNGSRVTSNFPVAITIKDDGMNYSIFGTCSDLGGDQIVPTPAFGTEYIATKGYLNSPGDQIFILATQNNTIVSQNGNPVDTIDAGETRQLGVGDSSTYVKASQPVSLLQISGIGCEMGIDILPQINCTGSDSIALARSTSEAFYVNLLVPNGGQNNFRVNGQAGIITNSIFKVVPGTNGQWFSGRTSLSTSVLPVGGSVLINNPSKFHLSVIHGGSTTGARFGYFSAFSCPLQSPLPVKLISFNASCKEQNVILNWVTTDEVNNSHFTIEKSKDAISWQAIGTYAAALKSAPVNNYSFIDERGSKNKSFYRLKQTDRNGEFTYSKVISSQGCTKAPAKIVLSPNPASTFFKIQADSLFNKIDVSLIDQSGKVVSKFSSGFKDNLIIRTNHLQSGYYYVRIIIDDQFVITDKLLIKR